MNWKPIEDIDVGYPIWVIKYDMFEKDRQFCSADTVGATKFTDCHGWYETEADALKVRNHFPDPSKYRIEKVYRRYLKD